MQRAARNGSDGIAAILGNVSALEAERNQGLKPEVSIYQACVLRFRPILMTTMAALLGGVPYQAVISSVALIGLAFGALTERAERPKKLRPKAAVLR